MKPTAFLAILIALLLPTGCTNLLEMQSTGDILELDYEGRRFTCELLTISDSLMYFIPLAEKRPELPLAPGAIYYAPSYIFSRGEVQGYANRNWVLPFVLFQAVPVVMLGIEAAAYTGTGGGFVAAVIVFGSLPLIELLALHFGTDEAPEFKRTLMEELQFYRKYARYPQGLTAEQLQLLLSVRNQTEPLALPAVTPARTYRVVTP